MSTKAYVKRVFVGNGTQSTIPSSLGSLGLGDLALVNADTGAILNATTAATLGASKFSKVQIAVGTENGLVRLSSAIQGATVSQYSGKDTSNPVLHQVAVGYNLSNPSGTLVTPVVGETYRLRILIKDSVRINGQRPTIYDVNYYAETTSVKTMALSVLKAFYYNQFGSNYASDKLTLTLVTNGTATVLGGTSTLTVVKGSKQVTALTGHGLVAGDLVRIGGTTNAFPVYQVESVSGATGITLTTPYVGDSATVAAANCLKITSETQYGFVIAALEPNGKVYNGSNDPYNDYTNILFTAGFTLASSAADPITDTSSVYVLAQSNPGQGYWKQVAADEDSSKGYLGEQSRRRFYDWKISNAVVKGTYYDKIEIVYSDYHLGDMQKTMDSPCMVAIYLPTTSNQDTNSGTNFRAVINAYFNAIGFTALA